GGGGSTRLPAPRPPAGCTVCVGSVCVSVGGGVPERLPRRVLLLHLLEIRLRASAGGRGFAPPDGVAPSREPTAGERRHGLSPTCRSQLWVYHQLPRARPAAPPARSEFNQ